MTVGIISVMADEPERDVDVDTRFLLANERTVLAWVRTAMALIAGGVGIHQFGSKVAAQTALAVALLVCGGASAAIGARRYAAADRANRRGELPPHGRTPQLLAVVIAVVAAALLVAILVDALG
ncbi:MAG: YidH family protein [Actinomycetes bacterium]